MSPLWLNARHLSRNRPALRDRVLHQEALWRDRLSEVIADGGRISCLGDDAAGALAPGAWLRGWGLDPNVFGAGAVTLGSFGPLLDGIPAAIDLFDGHSMLASPRALELAGIDGPRRFGRRRRWPRWPRRG
jgi:hypothetical protein